MYCSTSNDITGSKLPRPKPSHGKLERSHAKNLSGHSGTSKVIQIYPNSMLMQKCAEPIFHRQLNITWANKGVISCFFWISDGYLLGSNLSIPNCHWSFWAPQSRAKRPNRERYIIVSKSTFVDDTNDAIDTVVAVGPVGLSSSFSTYLTGPCKEKINQPQTTTNIIPVRTRQWPKFQR